MTVRISVFAVNTAANTRETGPVGAREGVLDICEVIDVFAMIFLAVLFTQMTRLYSYNSPRTDIWEPK